MLAFKPWIWLSSIWQPTPSCPSLFIFNLFPPDKQRPWANFPFIPLASYGVEVDHLAPVLLILVRQNFNINPAKRFKATLKNRLQEIFEYEDAKILSSLQPASMLRVFPRICNHSFVPLKKAGPCARKVQKWRGTYIPRSAEFEVIYRVPAEFVILSWYSKLMAMHLHEKNTPNIHKHFNVSESDHVEPVVK